MHTEKRGYDFGMPKSLNRVTHTHGRDMHGEAIPKSDFFMKFCNEKREHMCYKQNKSTTISAVQRSVVQYCMPFIYSMHSPR